MDVEQLYCKFAASNDMLSQGICYVQFEQKFTPQQWQAMTDAADKSGLFPIVMWVLIGALIIRSIGKRSWDHRKPKPAPRQEPRL